MANLQQRLINSFQKVEESLAQSLAVIKLQICAARRWGIYGKNTPSHELPYLCMHLGRKILALTLSWVGMSKHLLLGEDKIGNALAPRVRLSKPLTLGLDKLLPRRVS
uniref:Uncharacterized protein n=1 Tax=Pyxicephalus adspersus TaxID=30357 RepID=A0AAV2ZMX3_PYXAD|nr:TPA: hypothetical protein GDO54_015407 [Pyxicephalus adspersus]